MFLALNSACTNQTVNGVVNYCFKSELAHPTRVLAVMGPHDGGPGQDVILINNNRLRTSAAWVNEKVKSVSTLGTFTSASWRQHGPEVRETWHRRTAKRFPRTRRG